MASRTFEINQPQIPTRRIVEDGVVSKMQGCPDFENAFGEGFTHIRGHKGESFQVIDLGSFQVLLEKLIAAGEVTVPEANVLDGEVGDKPPGGVCVRLRHDVVAVFGV